MGYAQTSAEQRNIKVTHTFVAPPGDATAVVDIVDLENTSDGKKTFEHDEIWDVARRHIETDWLRKEIMDDQRGLVRVGTGDWSDGIDFEAPDRDLCIAKGESVPNTQMAIWVLPLVKALEPSSAMEIDTRVAAISALLTWGWAKNDPERAWKHLAKNTLAGHAVTFPTVWYGIWSGPDGMTSSTGEAWSSLVTPMTDFPTMNANQHAMPMLAALRVLGIEPTDKGLRIAPHVPMQAIALHTELLDVRLEGDHLTGTYRPIAHRILEVVLGTKSMVVDIPKGGSAFGL